MAGYSGVWSRKGPHSIAGRIEEWMSRKFLTRICTIGLALGALLAGMDLYFFGRPQVRIDSGDARLKGLVFAMPAGRVRGREQIVACATRIGIERKWFDMRGPPSCSWCGRGYLYSGLGFWFEKEPKLGERMLKDAAEYFRHPERRNHLPPGTFFTWATHWNTETNSFQVDSDQWTNENLDFAFAEMNVAPEPGGFLEHLRSQLKK